MARTPSKVVWRNAQTKIERSAAAYQKKIDILVQGIDTAKYMLDQDWVTGECREIWIKDLAKMEKKLTKLMSEE